MIGVHCYEQGKAPAFQRGTIRYRYSGNREDTQRQVEHFLWGYQVMSHWYSE